MWRVRVWLEGQKERGSEGGKEGGGGKGSVEGGIGTLPEMGRCFSKCPTLCLIPTVGRARGGLRYT